MFNKKQSDIFYGLSNTYITRQQMLGSMLSKKTLYFIIKTIIMTSCAITISGPPQSYIERFNSMIQPIDSEVASACNQYCISKGFNDIDFATLKDYKRFSGNCYACTLREAHDTTIFLSPKMIASIKEQIAHQKPISIYDRFVLLHELGHLYPYGYECAQQEKNAYAFFGAALGFGVVGGIANALVPRAHTPDYIATKAYLSIAILSAQLASCALGSYIYLTKVLAVKYTFKKWGFMHVDGEFACYAQQAYEERDADQFALELLSTWELNNLFALISSWNSSSITDEDAYHPTPHERCTAIVKEIKRRHL